MTDKRIIVHIINGDKFAAGYINFQLIYYKQYLHYFFLYNMNYMVNTVVDDSRVLVYAKASDLIRFSIIRNKILDEASLIIISAVSGHKIFASSLWKRSWKKKTFLQFVGGDYYCYRGKINYKKHLLLKQLKRLVRLVAGIILIQKNEYRDFLEIVGQEPNHFYAVHFPGDPLKEPDYETLAKQKSESPKILIVGNSADSSNHTLEVLDQLKKYRDKDIQVICPLSYGDSDGYAQKVIKKGKSIFENKFRALTEYMDYDDYVNLVSKAIVGVFNNDRQQARGNILLMLGCGAKVFLRESGTLYTDFSENGFIVFPIDSISEMDFDSFVGLSKEDANKNEALMKAYNRIMIDQWTDFYSKELRL